MHDLLVIESCDGLAGLGYGLCLTIFIELETFGLMRL